MLPEIIKLKQWAKQIKKIWRHPIYLVGSALHKAHPRDWDIRVELPAAQFRRLVGPIRGWEKKMNNGKWEETEQRWSNICVGFWHNGCDKTGLNIDFQFYPQSYCKKNFKGLPKRKLA